MADSVTPTGQVIHLDPFSGKLFDFNTVNSRVYLARSINSLLNAFGKNVIIEGLTVSSATLSSNNIATIIISSGRAVIDETLVEFPSSTTIDLDVTSLSDATGNLLIVSLNFQYISTIFSNLAKIILRHKDPTGNILSQPWTEQDRIVLAAFTFTKSPPAITQNNIPAINVLPHPTVTINDTSFEVYPYNNIVKNLRLITQ